MNVFLDPNQQLRSGWKFGVYVVVFLLFEIVAGILLSLAFSLIPIPDSMNALFDPRNEQLVELTFNGALHLFGAIAGLIFMARFVDHVPVGTFGVTPRPGWWRDLVRGGLIAILLLGALLAGCMAFGELNVRWTPEWTVSLILAAGMMALSAAYEEVFFRGYPMQVLMKGIGPWPAILVMSSLFGLLHYGNPHASALGIMNTVLAGLMLSAAYLRTRSLWLPYGLHVCWNIGLGLILGFPLSGIDVPSLWTARAIGSEIILGGSYGPEGGILATLLFGAGWVTVRSVRKRIP